MVSAKEMLEGLAYGRHVYIQPCLRRRQHAEHMLAMDAPDRHGKEEMRRRKTAMRAVTRRHAAGHHVEAPGPSPAGRGPSLRKD